MEEVSVRLGALAPHRLNAESTTLSDRKAYTAYVRWFATDASKREVFLTKSAAPRLPSSWLYLVESNVHIGSHDSLDLILPHSSPSTTPDYFFTSL
jgi:hypothetical protein